MALNQPTVRSVLMLGVEVRQAWMFGIILLIDS